MASYLNHLEAEGGDDADDGAADDGAVGLGGNSVRLFVNRVLAQELSRVSN